MPPTIEVLSLLLRFRVDAICFAGLALAACRHCESRVQRHRAGPDFPAWTWATAALVVAGGVSCADWLAVAAAFPDLDPRWSQCLARSLALGVAALLLANLLSNAVLVAILRAERRERLEAQRSPADSAARSAKTTKSDFLVLDGPNVRAPLEAVIGFANQLAANRLDRQPAPAITPAPAAGPDPAEARPSPAWQPRILVVEDMDRIRFLLEIFLHRQGLKPEVTTCGEEAVRLAAANDYDAILMDLQLLDIDGYTAAARIRAAEPPGRHTPIIALTASSAADTRERCLACGMDEYLSKPLDLRKFESVLARFIAPGKPGRREAAPLSAAAPC